jgi:hypothetical protein
VGELNRDKTEKPIEKSVTIKLDKERHLVLNDAALRVFEFDGGDLKSFISGNITLWDLVHLLRACLAHEDANLTIEETMKMVNQHNIQTTFIQLIKCFRSVIGQVNRIVKSEVKYGRR